MVIFPQMPYLALIQKAITLTISHTLSLMQTFTYWAYSIRQCIGF